MKKVIVGIFAHPDDESFGPSGTLAKFSKTHDTYIICVTNGEGGNSNSKNKKLGDIRKKELFKSAKHLGIKDIIFLGFEDGNLCNNIYHKLAANIETHLKKLKPSTLITFDQTGISGHIDHITVSLVTTFVFEKLPFVKKLMYYCNTEELRNEFKDYFIYVPRGYKKKEIHEKIIVEDVWDAKIKAIKEHKSQVSDAKKLLEVYSKYPKIEYFQVLEK